jgi:hypothetical protein
MTSGRVWSARAAALIVAIIIPACSAGTSNPRGVGVSTQSLWNSNAGTGAQPTGVPLFWEDPNKGIGGRPPLPDPQDIRTYTLPDIYILGLKHPLMVDVSFKTAPNVVLNENRAIYLIQQYRFVAYHRTLGVDVPQATLTEHVGLRQNARAHAKHYAVWHPTIQIPNTNAEKDTALMRLNKSKLTATALADLVGGDPTYKTGDDIAAAWIAAFGGTLDASGVILTTGILTNQIYTHLGVGFWQLGGTIDNCYWEALIAQNPASTFVAPTLPIIGPGF